MNSTAHVLASPFRVLLVGLVPAAGLMLGGQAALKQGALWGYSLQMMAAGQVLLLTILVGTLRFLQRRAPHGDGQRSLLRWLPDSPAHWAPLGRAVQDVGIVLALLVASWLCVVNAERAHGQAQFERYKLHTKAIDQFMSQADAVPVDQCAKESHSPAAARACLLKAKVEDLSFGHSHYMLAQATWSSPTEGEPVSLSAAERAAAAAVASRHLALPELQCVGNQLVASGLVHLHTALHGEAFERALETPLLRLAALSAPAAAAGSLPTQVNR